MKSFERILFDVGFALGGTGLALGRASIYNAFQRPLGRNGILISSGSL